MDATLKKELSDLEVRIFQHVDVELGKIWRELSGPCRCMKEAKIVEEGTLEVKKTSSKVRD